MSLHFIIDGYNVINQADFFKGMRALKEARATLVKIVQAKRIMKSKNNQVTIVFDGKDDCNLFQAQARAQAKTNAQGKSSIRILFSKGESADEAIKRMVNDSANPRQVVVVTNDKAIKFSSRFLGAKVISASEFLNQDQGKRSKVLKQRGQGDAALMKIELTHQQQEAINQELKEIWG